MSTPTAAAISAGWMNFQKRSRESLVKLESHASSVSGPPRDQDVRLVHPAPASSPSNDTNAISRTCSTLLDGRMATSTRGGIDSRILRSRTLAEDLGRELAEGADPCALMAPVAWPQMFRANGCLRSSGVVAFLAVVDEEEGADRGG